MARGIVQEIGLQKEGNDNENEHDTECAAIHFPPI